MSGGLDSAVALFWAKSKGYKVWALTFDYGQKHKKEIIYAKKMADFAKVENICLKISLPWLKSSLVCKQKTIPRKRLPEIPSTYVAGRNIIFLSYAVSLAESKKVPFICIGAHTLDYSGYPDCRLSFLQLFNKAVNLGIAGQKIKIGYPLLNKNKKQIIKQGLKLKVPFEKTWSCYEGKRSPCLRCDSCFYRMNAFAGLGLADPLLG